MKIKHSKLLTKNKKYILENVRQAKQYVKLNKLSEDDLKILINIDPTPTRKYVGWMAKIWITEKPDIDDLGNIIEEYDTLLNKGKIKTRDINPLKWKPAIGYKNVSKKDGEYLSKNGKKGSVQVKLKNERKERVREIVAVAFGKDAPGIEDDDIVDAIGISLWYWKVKKNG
jgi:hypothetical protein